MSYLEAIRKDGKTYYKVSDLVKFVGCKGIDYSVKQAGCKVLSGVGGTKRRVLEEAECKKLAEFMIKCSGERSKQGAKIKKMLSEMLEPAVEVEIVDENSIESNGEAPPIIDERVVLGKDFRIYGDIENPLFMAKDVADWIEHTDVSTMLRSVDENEKRTNNVCTNRGNRKTWFLTEDGLYEVLMQSRKPIAKEFKRNVKEILKSIRKNGGYIAGQENLSDEDLMARAILVANNKIKERDALIGKQKTEIKELRDANHTLAINIAKWSDRQIINALVRKFSARVYNGDFQHGFNTFYKELLYNKNINLKARTGGKTMIERIKDDEIGAAASVAASMCERCGIDIGETINEVNASKIKS